MIEDRFDFHLHTSCSDGTKTAAEAVELAARGGLAGVSLTDHDTIDAYAGGLPATPGGLRVLPGIEVSAAIEGVEVHILGYFPGGFPPGVAEMVDRLLLARSRRIRDGLRQLAHRGIEISWSEVEEEAGGRVVSRGHLAQILVKKHYVATVYDAFPDLLGPQVVRAPEAEAREIIAEIRSLSGIAMWAHPTVEHTERFLDDLVLAGLEGIELYTARRRATERERILRRAEGKNLMLSGGSDWHGQEKESLGRFAVGAHEVGGFLRRIGWSD